MQRKWLGCRGKLECKEYYGYTREGIEMNEITSVIFGYKFWD